VSTGRSEENHAQYVFESDQGTLWNENGPCWPDGREIPSERHSAYVVIIWSKLSSNPLPEPVR
jgi:hypothetical protein